MENQSEEEKVLNKIEKKIKEENRIKYIADFPDLVDLVLDNDEIMFLTFRGDVLPSIEIEKQIYKPPQKDAIDWLLPNKDNILKEVKLHDPISIDPSDASDVSRGCAYCQSELYPEIIRYFNQFSELPSKYHYDFLTLMAFHSHLIEKFNFSPILFLVATKDRGKTPTLKALAYISRRGILTETFREANLIRWSKDHKASVYFDVRNFPRRIEQSNSEDIIYGRAERGAKSSRVLYPEKGPFKDMVSFPVFGETGATSNKMVDSITEARCIVFHMPFSKKVFTIEPTPELGLPLKEKLTAFRMAHFNTPFVDVKKTQIGKLENYLRGYHQMVKTIFPSLEDRFKLFKKKIENQKKEEAQDSFEGRIIKNVIECGDKVEKAGLCLTYSDICANYNLNINNKDYQINEVSMGKILRDLGFRAKRNSKGKKRGIFYDEILVKELKDQYGLSKETSLQDESVESDKSEKDGNSIPRISKNSEVTPEPQLLIPTTNSGSRGEL